MSKKIFNENFQKNLEDDLSSKKSILLIYLFFILYSIPFFAEDFTIDYYGVVSTEIDANMSKMTSDLYYTQLSEINNFSVTDKRDGSVLTQIPDSSTLSNFALSFYTEIKKDVALDKWITVICVVDKANQEIHSKEKIYDSYYKILMESKNELKETIKQLIENDTGNRKTITQSQNVNFNTTETQIASTEVLAGTWIGGNGEENIEKIVILRGGRGFVIFKNGASMNIAVELTEQNKIIVTQKGKGNASFYPELPRNVALNAALTAEPIQWTLTLQNENILNGTKNTLLPDGEDYKTGSVKISWNRAK